MWFAINSMIPFSVKNSTLSEYFTYFRYNSYMASFSRSPNVFAKYLLTGMFLAWSGYSMFTICSTIFWISKSFSLLRTSSSSWFRFHFSRTCFLTSLTNHAPSSLLIILTLISTRHVETQSISQKLTIWASEKGQSGFSSNHSHFKVELDQSRSVIN